MIDPEFDGMTLTDAQAWLRDRLDEGAACPCCTQFAKVYRRKVYSTIARALILMWHKAGTTEYIDINAVTGQRGGDTAKLAYWGLIEQQVNAELWRVTPLGEQFVLCRAPIPKYCHIYDGRPLRFSGGDASIVDALGTRFNYDDLMRGV